MLVSSNKGRDDCNSAEGLLEPNEMSRPGTGGCDRCRKKPHGGKMPSRGGQLSVWLGRRWRRRVLLCFYTAPVFLTRWDWARIGAVKIRNVAVVLAELHDGIHDARRPPRLIELMPSHIGTGYIASGGIWRWRMRSESWRRMPHALPG